MADLKKEVAKMAGKVKQTAQKAARAAKAAGETAKAKTSAAAKKATASAKAGKTTASKATRAAVAKAGEKASEATARVKAATEKVAQKTRAVAKKTARRAAAKPAAKPAPAKKPAAKAPEPRAIDAEGYIVARIAGEEAAREAPRTMTEARADKEGLPPAEPREEPPGPVPYDEGLGELPSAYEDDAFVALPRDPRTLFFYWDFARDSVARAFDGVDHGRTQLWVYSRPLSPLGEELGEWERVRVVDMALESRMYYVHDLEPGRAYRGEVHVVGRNKEQRVANPSNEMALPRVGPSPLIDDRFIRIPWGLPLKRLGRAVGEPGGPFDAQARALLAMMSDWSKHVGSSRGAGGMGGRFPAARPSSAGGSPGKWNPGQ